MTAGRDEPGAATNQAALRFQLRATGIAELPDHAALRRFAAAQPAAFRAAILGFAGVAAPPDALAALLLDADLRPDDRLLVAGTVAPAWLGRLAHVIQAPGAMPATLRAIVAAERADVVVAPAAWLAAAGLNDAPGAGPRGVSLEALSDCNPAAPRPFPGNVAT